jgi:hypothetical protein
MISRPVVTAIVRPITIWPASNMAAGFAHGWGGGGAVPGVAGDGFAIGLTRSASHRVSRIRTVGVCGD